MTEKGLHARYAGFGKRMKLEHIMYIYDSNVK